MNTPEMLNEDRDKIVVAFFDTLIAYKADHDYRHMPRLRRLAELADTTPHGYGRNPEPLLPLTTDENLRKWLAGDWELEDKILKGCEQLPNFMELRDLTHRAA